MRYEDDGLYGPVAPLVEGKAGLYDGDVKLELFAEVSVGDS